MKFYLLFLVFLLIKSCFAAKIHLKDLKEKQKFSKRTPIENNSQEYKQNKANSGLNEYYGQPEQIHINYGCLYFVLNQLLKVYFHDYFLSLLKVLPNQMMITWVTLDLVNDSVVEYGQNSINKRANGTYKVFRDGGSEHRVMNIHRVLLEDLIPGQTYS